ncbi:GTPase Der [Spirochaetia bacterium]|nr:GTPase Der [Spirochaetia bacterium]GHU29397.1 GTPase Der [Spirochaetia bacterium]
MHLPIVAIVGRPNVGKSTLFNRLVHRRRVITDPTPGVTRDPIGVDADVAGKLVHLIDTGGFKLERSGLDDAVVERTLETIRTADVIILLLEAGVLTPEDEEFIAFLRPYQDRLLVAVNKTEGGRREAEALNFLSFGFETVYCISAEHGDRVAEFTEAIRAHLPETKTEEYIKPDVSIRVAILGKPNTGKSTLSNRLTDSHSSIVSEIPGTTRDVIEGKFIFRNHSFKILDTAGIRRKTKVYENVEYYSVNRAIKTIDEAELIFLMIDAVEGFSEQDKKIANLAYEKARGIILVLNKWDEMPQIQNTFQAVSDRIRFLFGQMSYAPLVPVSAREGTGVDKLLSTAITMHRQLTTRIETARINRHLEQWLTEHPPPIGPQTRFKVKYAVQTSVNPIVFRFFVSRPAAVPEAYRSYLSNKIRTDLGFSMIPIRIEIRASSKEKR